MLEYGMPYELFWHGDVKAVNYYIQMAENRQKQERDKINAQCYLQGQYIYTALCCAAPLFHDFAKQGTKAHKYPDKPFELKKPEQEIVITPEMEEVRKQYMMYRDFRIAEIHEKARKKKEAAANGGRN